MLDKLTADTLRTGMSEVFSKPIESLKDKIPDFKEVSETCNLTARDVNNNGELKEFQKKIIENESPYSEEINEDIKTIDELDIYTGAGLKEKTVNEKMCLVKDDIDPGQVDEQGMGNLDRMKKGKPPLDKDGSPIEVHHIGQKDDGHFAELTKEEHRGEGNSSKLHDSSKPSEVNREEFQKQKRDHWKARAEDFQKMEA